MLARGAPKLGRHLDGHVTDTAGRPDALADYFEQVQWQVRFAELTPTSNEVLGPTLNVDVSAFTLAELRRALHKMKNRKAAGPDDVPPEFWKTIGKSNDACNALLEICQTCWREKDLPASWKKANVTL